MFSKEIPFDSAIKVSFFDKDGTKVNGISIEQANKVHELDQDTLFYFKTGDGTEKELTIEEVRELPNKKNILPSKPCDTGPKECGPPLVRFFGGGGFGAAANAIISPISSSVIGFDVVNRGKKYKTPPNAELVDPCGKGSGSSVVVTIDEDENSPDFGKIDDVIVIAPGDGYISAPDGSLGGNDRVWKEPDEGWCETPEGGYCVVQPYRPIKLPGGSTYHPPDGPPRIIREGGELITIDLVPVKPPDEEEEKNTSDPKGPTDLISTGPTPRRSGGITPHLAVVRHLLAILQPLSPISLNLDLVMELVTVLALALVLALEEGNLKVHLKNHHHLIQFTYVWLNLGLLILDLVIDQEIN